MSIKFSEEAQKILKKAKKERNELMHPFIGSEHLLLSILNNKNNISKKLNDYGINYNKFKKELINTIGIGKNKNEYYIYTPLLKRILENSIIESIELNYKEITLNNIFLCMLDENEGVAVRILNRLGIDLDNLYDEFNNQVINKNIPKKLSINECSIDLTKKAKENELDPLIGRDKELESLIEILSRRNKNNPLLIGEAGVGKTAIVEELARRIINNNVPDKLKNTKLLSVSMASLVSGTKYRGEFEERLTKLIKELENNPEIIVFIDEIHTIIGAGGAEGAIDASNILKPALARGKIKVIGATTTNEYKDTISKDKALNRRFQTIIVNENTIEETKEILYRLKPIYEEYHHVLINDDIIDNIVLLADKYIHNQHNPDKSIDILDRVSAKVSLIQDKNIIKLNKLNEELKNIKKEKNSLIINHNFNEATVIHNTEVKIESSINKLNLLISNKHKKTITIQDVIKVIEEKNNIPINNDNKLTRKIHSLSKYLKKKIIGQDNVIDELIKVTNKIFLGIKKDVPYSFLFIGNSGVGKTMLVKEYSKYMNIPLIRLDMSEYKEPHSISKIIGSPPGYIGYNEYGNILEKVRNNPFSIILLDEIEKANQEVINVFLSILDEGETHDSHGEKVNFRNTIIIMTSNIGSDKENIGFNKNNNCDTNLRNTLSTSFVNRINKVLYFNNLNQDIIKKIITNKVKELITNYHEHNINLKCSNKIINDLINESNYQIYGARHINKIIEDKIDILVMKSINNNKKHINLNKNIVTVK